MKPTQADQASDARIAAARSAINTAIIDTVKAYPETTYEELVEALAGLGHRYAQSLRQADEIPVALPVEPAPTTMPDPDAPTPVLE